MSSLFTGNILYHNTTGDLRIQDELQNDILENVDANASILIDDTDQIKETEKQSPRSVNPLGQPVGRSSLKKDAVSYSQRSCLHLKDKVKHVPNPDERYFYCPELRGDVE